MGPQPGGDQDQLCLNVIAPPATAGRREEFSGELNIQRTRNGVAAVALRLKDAGHGVERPDWETIVHAILDHTAAA